MSQSTYAVLDADGHVTESYPQLAKYLDEPYRRRSLTFPLYTADGWDRRLVDKFHDWAGSAEEWLRALDKGGMELTVLYPTLGLFMSFLKDREWAVRLCRAYNTLMHEEFIKVSPRLQAVALLPVQDPAAAALELRRAVSELGHVGGMLAADGTHLLGDERFLPVFEEADRLGVMLGVHASGSHLGGAGVDLFPRFIQAHTCSHAFGQMRQITSMVYEGIPERFPRLRIAFLEAGCGWAPYWMERMDDEYAKRAEEAPALRKKPSEYIRSGSIYFSCEADEWLLPQALKLVGENQIVYASDFPTGTTASPAPSTRSGSAATSRIRRSARSSRTTRAASTASSPKENAPVMDCCSHEGPSKGDAKFDIQKVADGVYAAVAAPAYKVNSNTAIIESDDGVVVVDTHSKPSAARVIVAHLRDMTTKPVRYVVNTHFHWDHWHGNEVYPSIYPGRRSSPTSSRARPWSAKGSSASRTTSARCPRRSPSSRPPSRKLQATVSASGCVTTCAWPRRTWPRSPRSSPPSPPWPSSGR